MNQTYQHDSLKALKKVAGPVENLKSLEAVELAAWRRSPQKSDR
jgi:hypothetical protein